MTLTVSCMHAGLVFDWLYPAHFPTVLACLDAWSDTPAVSTPVLKFMAEFVMNKTQRLAFDASSASGILLFREVSKVRTRVWRPCAPCVSFGESRDRPRKEVHPR